MESASSVNLNNNATGAVTTNTTNTNNNINNINNIKMNRNYWKSEEENILREWADKAQCYELMNAKSHAIYNTRNTFFVIPVIIISTLTGTANFAQDRVPAQYLNLFVMLIGGFNILAGIITTISQYLKIAELNESYRVGALQWGKFYRNIKMELIKHPLDRMDAGTMLLMCKEEFDRLLEIYPDIPKKIIDAFKVQFKDDTELSKPEICDVIEPTLIYPMTPEERNEMIKLIIEGPPKPKVEIESENTSVEIIQEPELDQETSMKIEKFKQTFYKINGRYPSDTEIQNIMSNFLGNTKIEVSNMNDIEMGDSNI